MLRGGGEGWKAEKFEILKYFLSFVFVSEEDRMAKAWEGKNFFLLFLRVCFCDKKINFLMCCGIREKQMTNV